MQPAPPLPASAVELIDVIGYESTITLCKQLGGAELRVNGHWKPAIVAAIGVDAHHKLADYYGGEILTIPTCHRALQQQRAFVALRSLTESTANQAALATGVTSRTIRNWKRKHGNPAPTTQGDLFGE